MEEEDGDRLHARGYSCIDQVAYLLVVEFDENSPGCIDPFTHLEAPCTLDERSVFLEEKIVGFGTIDTPDLVDVAESLRREKSARRASAFEDSVDGDCRAVQEETRGG